jgi:gas vesicle protein
MKFKRDNTALTTIGLLAGLAVGAVVAALFAPKSGSDTREDIANGIKSLFGSEEESTAVNIKPHAVEDLRLHSKEVADQLAGTPETAVDLTKTTLKADIPKSRQLPLTE